MSITEKMQGLLGATLDVVQQDVSHALAFEKCQAIYEAFSDLGVESARQAHNVLAVLMAKLALQYIQPAVLAIKYYAELESGSLELPINWVNITEKVVRGELKTDDIAFGEVQQVTHQDWESVFPTKPKAQTAFSVIKYTVATVDQGWPAGRRGINIRTKEEIVIPYDANRTAAEMYALVHDDITKGMAMSEQWRTDPARALTFWTWWLTQAVPYAWDYAEKRSTEPITLAFPAL